MNFFKRFTQGKKSEEAKETLDKGLEKTKQSFWHKFSKVVVGKSKVDEAVLDELEETLIAADVGVATTLKIITNLEKRVAQDKYLNTSELQTLLQQEITALFDTAHSATGATAEQDSKPPYVMLVVGVNGVGKTTTIGKLAAHFQQAGKKVVLGAADTFRAAAVAQLEQWGQRVNVPVIARGMQADPAAVAYDAVKAAIDTQADVVLVDTAGRLHNKVNLMHELAKIKRTIQKLLPKAPHDVLLVLDGGTGQNAFVQTKAFTEAIDVTSLAITKLDGTAKGGVVIGIVDQFHIPVKYIGLGEKVTDLQPFDSESFVATLFQQKD